MKRFTLAVIAALATIGVSAVEVQKVDGPNKEQVMAFTTTYQYPADDIEDAIIAKLKEEGLSGKKASNNFYAYKGVKYNGLWNRTFDFYIAVNGSHKSGTIYLVLSTGYDNYITDSDKEENEKVSDWLESLDADIQNYVYNQQLSAQQEETDEAEKELKNLKKQKEKTEQKIAANEKELKTFEASRTIVDEANTNTVDPKVLKKEQKQYDKLVDKKSKLQSELDSLDKKIDKARDKYSEEKDKLKKLKSNRP